MLEKKCAQSWLFYCANFLIEECYQVYNVIMTCLIRISYIFSYVVNLPQHYEHHYNLVIKITLTY